MKKLLFILFISIGVFQYTDAQTVTGVITGSDDGGALPGVNVRLKGSTTVGTITDLEGRYAVEVTGEAPVLVFSFVGYVTKEVAVSGQTNINVQLDVETTGLDEVIVVGYGTQKKSLVTGAIAKVDGEEIAKSGSLRVNQALQGKTAGVVVTNSSGQPGDAVSVRIRGTGTIGDAEPLYIVDGLPLSSGGLDFINNSDIESIEVLKDAAASAIYGARGANGVVLITTKTGKTNQKFTVTYDGYYGAQNPWRKLDILGTNEYTMLVNEALVNDGQAPRFVGDFSDTTSTDWQDEMFYYNAPKMSHVVSFMGGNEKSSFSSSLSYFGQDGIVAEGHSNFKRITYRLNTSHDFGFLTLGSVFNYANIQNKGIAANDKFGGNSLIQALNTPPIVPVQFEDGTWATPSDFGLAMQEITNPIAILNYSNTETKTNKIVGGLNAEFDLGDLFEVLKGLKFRTSFNTEIAYVSNRGYTPEYYLDVMHNSLVNKVNSGVDQYTKWNIENLITFDKSFGEHNMNLMIGQSSFKETSQGISGSKSDVIFDDLDYAYLNNAQDPLSAVIGGGYFHHTILSFFGRVNYDYAGKYMLTAIARADGSSRFGANNKFGFFPSVSAGWVISRENFMSPLSNIVSFLKLRASWGQNGNENIGDFRFTSIVNSNLIYYFGDVATQYNGQQPAFYDNPNLRWETSEQTNIALDMGFLNNALTVNVDYYTKKTKDWLLGGPPGMLSAGNTAPSINGGEVKNSGIELELGYKNSIGDLKYNVSFTGAYNKNEVIDIPNFEKKFQEGDGGFGHNGILLSRPGIALYTFYGMKTDGIFQNQEEIDAYVNSDGELLQPNAQPGDFRFLDSDGDGEINTDMDRELLGDRFPDFTGGITINLEWEGIDFSMFWYAALGHQIWDGTKRYDQNFTNFRGDALNRWTGEGTTNEYPRLTYSDNNNNWSTPSDFFVKDADFLRLKNISLGYTLPSNIIQMVKLSKVRVYVAAENLLTFTKYDGFEPEIGSGVDNGVYPQARTILGGISITF